MGTKLLRENLSPAQLSLDRAKILAIAKSEMGKHRWDFFMDQQHCATKGGKGAVVRGCPPCRKQLDSIRDYVDHLYEVALPKVIELSE
jgi:hypothetical protein